MDNKHIFNKLQSYLWISIGLLIYAFGWTAFLIPSKIIGGGVAGISTLLYYITGLPVGLWIFGINLLFIFIAYKHLGLRFVINSLIGITLSSLFFSLLQKEFPHPLVQDQFMAALVGAGIAGAGLGITFSAGGNSGGFDIVALVISKYRSISPGSIILVLNVFVISSSFFVFHSAEKVVYGFVVMAVNSYALDVVLNGIKQSYQIMIFSRRSDAIAEAVSKRLHRGVTMFKGYGWYSKQPFDIILTIAHREDKANILRIIKEIDDQAFVSISRVQGVFGSNFERLKV